MAIDLSQFSATWFNWFQTGLFFIIAFVVLAGGFFGGLILRKKRKMNIPVLEVVNTGGGKVAVFKTMAGYFKSKTVLFGLLDMGGEENLRTKDGRIILDVSSQDYHNMGGRPGFIVKRKDDDHKILVPINSVVIENEKIIANIAPGDFRDASISIIEQTRRETSGFFDKYGQTLVFAGTLIFCLLAIIFIVQMWKHATLEVKDLLLTVTKMIGESSALPSAAP